MIETERRECECGNFIVTNDPYMIDAWKEWHADGSFTAGSYHRPTNKRSMQMQQTAVTVHGEDPS